MTEVVKGSGTIRSERFECWGLLLEGPLTKHKRGSWLVDYRRSYLQYILNRIDFGDQAPYIFAFSDMQSRLSYDLSAVHTLTLSARRHIVR